MVQVKEIFFLRTRSLCIMIHVATRTLVIRVTDVETSASRCMPTVIADWRLLLSPIWNSSSAASHQVKRAPRRTLDSGMVMMVSVVKVGHFPCPLTATTQTAASSVTTPIKTVSISVRSLTTPVRIPVSLCMRTCAGVSTGAGRTMRRVDHNSDAHMTL